MRILDASISPGVRRNRGEIGASCGAELVESRVVGRDDTVDGVPDQAP